MGSPKNTTPHANTKSVKKDVSDILRPKTKEEINNGQKYLDQLKQLHITVGKNKTMRALSDWALNFFDDEPEIKNIAIAVSGKVDKTIFAQNRLSDPIDLGYLTPILPLPLIGMSYLSEHFQTLSILDVQNIEFIPGSYRKLMEKQSKTFEKTTAPWAITYRMPKILASAMVTTKSRVGKCEEHSMLSLYLLNVGHMIQNMPYGQLKNDIFYTGAATKGHAMALLVKGMEFKKAILRAKRETQGKSGSEITRILDWMLLNSDKWGESSWVVDGWDTKKVSSLASKKEKLTFHYGITNCTFKRAITDNKLSKWDLTIRQMIYRVAKVHGIKIK